jgi:hypothetical protein
MRPPPRAPALQPDATISNVRWVRLLTAGLSCRAGLPDCVDRSGVCSSDANVTGTTWHVCEDLLPSAGHACTALSIGIGGDWFFEQALRRRGCRVHGFDPTVALRSRHEAFAADHNMSFHFQGLGRPAGNRNAYGAIDVTTLAPLGALFASAGVGADGAVDVLKIDCEGCEWAALADVAARAPALLSRVSQLLIEVHMTPGYGFGGAAQLGALLEHLLGAQGFRLHRTRANLGYARDRNLVPDELVRAGWPRAPCCAELHFVRARATPAVEAAARPART